MSSTVSSLVGARAHSCSFDYEGGCPALCLMGGGRTKGVGKSCGFVVVLVRLAVS